MDKLTGDADIDKALEEVVKLLQTKGKEYTAGDADRLKNFKEVANVAGITPEQAWLVFFNKHYKSVQFYVRNASAQTAFGMSEPIEGRITDMISYLLLFYKMVVEPMKKGEFKPAEKKGYCQDCGLYTSESDLHDKSDHHGGTKHVCKDREACHRRGG